MSKSPTNTNSGAAQSQFFMRKWSLQVEGLQDNNVLLISSDDLNQPLRVTFDVQTVWYQWYWQATIKIYNLNQDATQWLLGNNGASGNTSGTGTNAGATASGQSIPISQGMKVTLKAGYQLPGACDTIWEGFVLQPMFDRVSQTDFIITLNCVIGLNEDARNFINYIPPVGLNPLEMVQQMADQCFHKITVNRIAPTMSKATPLSYPKVIFGNFGKHINEISRTYNKNWWLDGRGFNVGDLIDEFPKKATYTFVPPGSPSSGIPAIIGTPVQTQFGVNATLLLCPFVKVSNPPMGIELQNVVVQQLQKQIGNIQSIGVFPLKGSYAVIGARYVGDTRGNEWYTYVTGYLGQGYMAAAAAGLFNGFKTPPTVGQ